ATGLLRSRPTRRPLVVVPPSALESAMNLRSLALMLFALLNLQSPVALASGRLAILSQILPGCLVPDACCVGAGMKQDRVACNTANDCCSHDCVNLSCCSGPGQSGAGGADVCCAVAGRAPGFGPNGLVNNPRNGNFGCLAGGQPEVDVNT